MTRIPLPAPPRQQFVFIGGLHRSGTSLLASLLAQHPDASALHRTGVSEDEGQFLQTVYRRDSELGGAGRFAFNPAALHEPCADAGQAAAIRTHLVERWSNYWDTSRSTLIEKTPGNCLNASFLQSVFGADCAFVFITRHPIANAMATRKWSGTSLFALIEHWLHTLHVMRLVGAGLNRVAWIAYENLVAEPTATLNRVAAHLGLPAYTPDTSAVRNGNRPYFAAWHDRYQSRIGHLPDTIISGAPDHPSIATRAIWAVRAELRRHLLRRGMDVLSTGREAGAIVNHYESRLRMLGYSALDTDLRPPCEWLVRPGELTSFPGVSGRRYVDRNPVAAQLATISPGAPSSEGFSC